MIFKVMHINAAGQRRLAKVTAANTWDALHQMDVAFGQAVAAACVRLVAGLALVRGAR